MTKLTKEQELEICKLYQNNVTTAELARMFDAGETTITRKLKKHGVYMKKIEIVKRNLSSELKQEICKEYLENKIIKELEIKYDIPRHIITKILKENNISIKTYGEIYSLKDSEKQQIIQFYVQENKTLREIARLLSRSVKIIHRFLLSVDIKIKNPQEFLKTPLSEQDELNIVKDYIENKMSGPQVCSKYKIRQKRFYGILNKYGHETRNSNDTRMICPEKEQLEEALRIYEESKSIGLVATYLNTDHAVVRRIFKEHNIKITKYERQGLSFYDTWKILYGEEKATKMNNEYLKKQSVNNSGKNNSMYGRPSPNGSGQGWKGYYKDFYFRSLRELSYLLFLDENNIPWETAERKKFAIKYKNYDGTDRTYRPDFLINGNTLVEIKPKRLQKSPLILLKTAAAIEFCKNKDLKYEIFDFPVDGAKIKKALDSGFVKFAKDYEQRFLEYIKTH